MYSGIISIDNNSVVATRDWVGTRYAVNLGILFADAATTLDESFQIASNLSPTNPVLYNKNHKLFDHIKGSDILESSDNSFLDEMIDRSINELDLTEFQKRRLREQDLSTIGDVLTSSEHILKKGYYIGDVRSRQMHNAAQAAVMEYLAG